MLPPKQLLIITETINELDTPDHHDILKLLEASDPRPALLHWLKTTRQNTHASAKYSKLMRTIAYILAESEFTDEKLPYEQFLVRKAWSLVLPSSQYMIRPGNLTKDNPF